MMRLNVLGMAAAIAGGVGLATVANAAPLPAPSSSVAGDQADIARVGFGCPFGFVPDYYGGCRRPFRRYGYGYGGYGYGYRPFGYVPPRPFYRPYGFYGPRPFF